MFTPVTERLLQWQVKGSSFTAGFTTRQGGVSSYPEHSLNMGLHINDEKAAVLENRLRVSEEVGFPLEKWILPEQVHGTKVAHVAKDDRGRGARELHTAVPGVDGLITQDENVVLAGFYADCVPLYFKDESTGWIGIAHAGWKGSVQGMAKEMVNTLVRHGADLDTLVMGIGPSISSDVYEVDERVVQATSERFRKKVLSRTSGDTWHLDLKHLNRLQAEDAGLKGENVFISSYCTYQQEELFFSHRRDKELAGRMLGFIVRPV